MIKNYIFIFCIDATTAELSHGSNIKEMHERSSGASPLRPEIPEPLPNVTVAVGREATLPCVVRNLGDYKVYQEFCQYQIFRRHFKKFKNDNYKLS